MSSSFSYFSAVDLETLRSKRQERASNLLHIQSVRQTGYLTSMSIREAADACIHLLICELFRFKHFVPPSYSFDEMAHLLGCCTGTMLCDIMLQKRRPPSSLVKQLKDGLEAAWDAEGYTRPPELP